MVGILIVSHSKEVASGTKKLAEEMMQKEIPIAAVGGTEDSRLGTDSNLIYQALEKLDKSDGVIIFADMGSAVMNAEMAFELFEPEVQEKFVIANAPIVEGAITAALESSFGKGRDEILEFLKEEDLLQKRS